MSAPRRPRRRPEPPAVSWAVGVDVGGTWLRVLALSDRGQRRAVSAPTGRTALGLALRAAWHRLGLSRPAVAALVVASRGVWTAGERRAAARPLAGLARQVFAISDVEAAHLGALGAAPGILLLAGTGSIALGRDARGRWARAGGLGPLLGDGGSAFAIGRDWLVAEAAAGDAARARALAVGPNAVARIAGLAPMVLARARGGDRHAREVVRAAQEALAALAAETARRLQLPRPAPATWAGGLMADSGFRAGVWAAARRGGRALAPRAPLGSGLDAAAALARSLAEGVAATPRRAVSATGRPPSARVARPSTGRRSPR